MRDPFNECDEYDSKPGNGGTGDPQIAATDEAPEDNESDDSEQLEDSESDEDESHETDKDSSPESGDEEVMTIPPSSSDVVSMI